jgi:hypothetical protein
VLRSVILALAIVGVADAQDSGLTRVKEQAEFLRQFQPEAKDFFPALKSIRDRSVLLHTTLRDWIESRLPKSKATLDGELQFLALTLATDLRRAGLNKVGEVYENFEAGFVTVPEFIRPVEDPDKLVVIMGIGLPCGRDDVVYVYDYSQGSPRRILESAGSRDHDESILSVHFSKYSATRSQQILTLRFAVQCGSSWNGISYDLYRYSPQSTVAEPALSGMHDIWFGDDGPFVRLTSDDLLMEMRDRSIDSEIHNRAHVLHFRTTDGNTARVEPVALQPQDFVDEWLTRPWSEMASLSDDEKSEYDNQTKLEKWHKFLGGNFGAGEFSLVQSCSEKPNQWQIGVDLHSIQGKNLPEPLGVYFLVQQLEEPYRYKMTDISFSRQEGCPGESGPSLEKPTLFPAKK